MNISPTKRSLIAVLVALAVCLLIYASRPPIINSPKGILLPEHSIKLAISNPDKIALYSNLPLAAIRLGHISIYLHSTSSNVAEEKEIAHYAQKLAATVGANGVFIQNFGHTSKQTSSDEATYIFSGIAIFSAQHGTHTPEFQLQGLRS